MRTLSFRMDSVRRPVPLLLTVFCSTVLGTSCREQQVISYRTPKENAPTLALTDASTAGTATASPADMANTAVRTAEGSGLTWNAPAEWKSKPSSPMRKGSYTIPGLPGADAELSITAFPGDVGGELANVNRWRNQLQLPPVGEAELTKVLVRFEANALKFAVVDIVAAGNKPNGILGASVPNGNSTWFFKMTGPTDLLAREKPRFLEFLKTVKAP